jgi:hypothetical protein
MKKVESSTIEAIGYKDGILSVKFKSGPNIYDYRATQEEHHALMHADSIGKHFHANIKGRDFTKRES